MGAKKLERSAAETMLEEAIRNGDAVKKEFSLDAITVDRALQSRVATHPEHVGYLAEILRRDKYLRPGVIFHENGVLRLADGFHRFAAYRKCSDEFDSMWNYEIQGGFHEAMLYSVSANLENSLPPTPEDRKKAAAMMLADPVCWGWEDAEIARRCGLYPRVVKTVRFETCRDRSLPLPKVVVGFRDGRPTDSKLYDRRTATPEERLKYNKTGKVMIGKESTQSTGYIPHLERAWESERQEAVRAIRDLDQRRRDILASDERLCSFLMTHGVLASPCQVSAPRDGVMWGLETPTAFFVANSGRTFCELVGRLVLQADRKPGVTLVIVEIPEDPSKRLRQLTLASFGVTILRMTPEEVVARFGPSGGILDA